MAAHRGCRLLAMDLCSTMLLVKLRGCGGDLTFGHGRGLLRGAARAEA
jgi:hypothetical protein